MVLNIETAHPMVQSAVGLCVAAFLIAFALGLCSTWIAITRTRTLIDAEDDRRLGYGERLGRRSSRFNTFLVGPEFRPLRILYYGAWGTAAASFLILFILVSAFGDVAKP
jgi:hypothetical protein